MDHPARTQKNRIEEISVPEKRIRELEKSEAEHKRVAEALRHSEENFRRSLDDSPLGVRIITEEGETIYANRAILDIYGFDNIEAWLKTPQQKRYTPESYAEYRIRKGKRKRGDYSPSEYEMSIVRTDGEVRRLQVFRRGIVWNGEKQFQVIYHDITERKRAEQALRQEYSFRNAIIDNVAEGLCVCHETTEYPFLTFTIWNDRMTKITGYTAEEINRLGWYQTLYPDPELQAKAIERMGRMRQGEDLPAEEWEITRADGAKRILNISTSVVESGDVVHVLALRQDVTERNRAREALHESETRYRLLAENATDVIWTVDMDMRLTYISPSVTKLLGFTVEEAMGRTMQQAFTPAAFEKAIQLCAEELAIEQTGHGDLSRSRMMELELVRKDGNTVPVEAHTCFVRDPTGKVIGILSIVRDIAERKRMEEALRESEHRYHELSMIDDLTQLYNSRHFYIQLTSETERSNRYGQPLTLLLLDLDDFKAYNDTYGHIEGDQVLLRLGRVVKRCLRQTDSAYRYGGEEFTILLPMTTSEEGIVTAERIRAEVKKERFSPTPSQDVHVTVSIGLAQYRTQEDMKAFVHRVDRLMYQGKKNGKDRVCSDS